MAVLEGNLIRWTVRFRDGESNTPVDPDVVTFAYQVGSSTPVAAITYSGASSPLVGTLARRGLGWYETWTPSTAASQAAKWVSTGAGEATIEDFIEGAPTQF